MNPIAGGDVLLDDGRNWFAIETIDQAGNEIVFKTRTENSCAFTVSGGPHSHLGAPVGGTHIALAHNTFYAYAGKAPDVGVYEAGANGVRHAVR
ncbi:MAG: hypothetical protein JXR37_14985 [Kiritimatiellae bacterium]|nr:hypothetical protein [Kiritimatiellia bacterium]